MEHVLFLHQTNEDLTPPGVYFPKVSGRRGGVCVLCGGGVCWPAPPPCLFVTSNCSAATVSILRNVMV